MSFTINTIKKLSFWGLGGLIFLFLFASSTARAQSLTHTFRNTSLSDALIWIDNAQSYYKIHFIFDELEDFTVTTSIRNASVEDAVRQVIGFYPMHTTFERKDIYIECVQKSGTKLSGHIVDEKGVPMPFANVSLLSVADSSFITGGVSNENGDFVIPCQMKHIIAKISTIGYKTVIRNAAVGKMGTITLQPETYTIKGVEIKGEIPQYKMVTGGMAVDVQHSVLHDVGTADDLLSMIPMVQKRDGKFEVLAKGEPEIYINNKKVTGANELKMLKSADIKNVEVITAPGAKYNAEVNAVIRIKTLKPQGDGFSLSLYNQSRLNNKWYNYDDLTLKYRTNGLEAFANVALDNGNYSTEQDVDQEIHISKDLFNAKAILPVRSTWTTLYYKAGLSYDFNTDHSIGFSISSQHIFSSIFKTDMEQHYTKNGAFYGDVFLETDIREKNKPVWELNSYYVGKVGKLGIDFNATVLRNCSENINYQYEHSEELGSRPITTTTDDKSTMAAGKLVLTYPVWKGELTGGSEVTSTQRHGNNLNAEGIIPASDTEREEKNIAGFAEYQMQLGQWHMNAGLRYEHVSTNYTSFGVKQEEPSRTYNDLFPTLSAAWQKGKWGTQLSYTKRITRPQYSQLTSMVVYDSRMLYEGGNPMLRPSIRQGIDFILTYAWLNFATGFTRENDFFTHTGKIYDEENEIIILTPENFDHQDRVYATLTASPKIGIWQPITTLHYYQQMFDSEKYGAPKKLNKPEFSARLQNWFILGTTAKALLDINYTGSNHWGMMYRGTSCSVNARVQKTFLKGNLIATLYADDIFRSARNNMITYYG
ncbi:MAG: outer membrane beta-barrel protein, partial [Prevotella sp.]|nr:outer membrane beta-barrel protein [Prevotella sp.]